MPASRRAWLLGVLALALPSLALVAKLPAHPVILRVLNNAAHAPVFGAAAVALFALLRLHPGISRPAAFALAWLCTVAIGGAIELIQPAIGRSGEWSDFMNDALGAAAGLSIAALWDARRSTSMLRARWPALLLLAVTATACVWPVAKAALAYALRAERFPTLFVDASRLDRYFLRHRGVDVTHVEPAGLEAHITGNAFPGISLIEPRPDWTGYRQLVLELANPGERPIELTLRVHDARHDNQRSDRYNRIIPLAPRSRMTVSIPLAEVAAGPAGRQLDLTQIAGLMIFSSGSAAERGQNWQILGIRLE